MMASLSNLPTSRGGGSLGALPRCISAPASLSANLRSIVYNIHVRTSSEPNAAFAHLLQVYETSDFIDEKLHVLGALGRFPSVKLKTRALEWAWREVSAARTSTAFSAVSQPTGRLSMGVCAGQVGCFERTVLADHRVPIANFQTEQAVTAVEAFLAGRPKARLPAHWVCSLKTSAQGLPCTPAM
ncbi:hypothetical protein DYB34_002557 [Aphanomyces astaci]|uniref:ERAP1-like C-terminal domain-containing protein n=1 Tax=Aphanomyces astaci TaxID=112090 RepID=A0A3R6ZQC6_APHAT|nr:hypothetical protein DYB34_002557 [Aphanomyces astaci]